MLLSRLFTKTQKNFPAEEEAINAKLLIRAGFIRKMSAGVYSYLPLAWRVIKKIEKIVREEMDAIGGQEVLMPALVAKEYWDKSNRWGVDVAYKLESPYGEKFGLGWTHEEVITAIAAQFISSYHDLPSAVYQIQTKFRAEPRAKNGLLRGREFIMKDLYSFHATKEDLDAYYQKVIKAYQKVFKRLRLKTKVAEAAGGPFTKEYTHEFQVLAPSGEDTIFYCTKCDFAQNKEIAIVQQGNRCPNCGGDIELSNAIEVGNVFKLGTRYSDAFDLKFTDKDGGKKPVIMGSYGIGISRCLASLVEVHNDEKGMIWSESVAPFKLHLIALTGKAAPKKGGPRLVAGREGGAKIAKLAGRVYTQLEKAGVEVLYDDRDVSAGEKFSDADLIGIPWRAVISERTGGKIELKGRDSDKAKLVTLEQFLKTLNPKP